MNAQNKKSERRIHDRRQVTYEFGSPEWIEHVKKNYIAWPKTDRRIAVRRDDENPYDSREENQSRSSEDDFSGDLLSTEEKLYFNKLFMDDAD